MNEQSEQDWNITISFGPSKSPNFARALRLAKKAPSFVELEEDGTPLYIATYSAARRDFLNFLDLRYIVSLWKSCSISIGGFNLTIADFSLLNCYALRCRVQSPDYCREGYNKGYNFLGCQSIHRSIERYVAIHGINILVEEIADDLVIFNKKKYIEIATMPIDALRDICPVFDYQEALEAITTIPQTMRTSEARHVIGLPGNPIAEFWVQFRNQMNEELNNLEP